MCGWRPHQTYWPPLPLDQVLRRNPCFFGTFVDQHHHNVDVIVVVTNGSGHFLQQDRLTRPRRAQSSTLPAPSVRQGRPLASRAHRAGFPAQFGGRGATAPGSQKPEFHGGFCRSTIDLLDLSKLNQPCWSSAGARAHPSISCPVEVPILR